MNTPQNTLNRVANAVRPSPMTQIQRQELLKEARATVPPHIRRFIAQEAVRSQVANAKKQYYSTIRFAFNVEEVPPAQPGGPVTAWKYTLARDRLIAFSYGIQDVATSAGFADGYMPSELDTNLITKGDTGGATVEIHGLSLYLSETSDAHLARLIWANTFVDISLDGSNRYRLLGKMGRIPQGGGLYGAGQSLVAPPPLNASSAMVGTLTNGIPASGNYMKLERIRWNPSSKVDSKFQLRFFVPKPLSFTVSKRDAAPGTAPFQPPIKTGDEGTVVDVTCYLHTREIMPRSTQA